MSMTAFEYGNRLVKGAGLGNWLVRSGLVLGKSNPALSAGAASAARPAMRPPVRQPRIEPNQISPASMQAAGGRYVFNRGMISPQFAAKMAPYLAGGRRKFTMAEMQGLAGKDFRRQALAEYAMGANKPGGHRFEPRITGADSIPTVAGQPIRVPPAGSDAGPAAPEGRAVGQQLTLPFAPVPAESEKQSMCACFYGYALGKESAGRMPTTAFRSRAKPTMQASKRPLKMPGPGEPMVTGGGKANLQTNPAPKARAAAPVAAKPSAEIKPIEGEPITPANPFGQEVPAATPPAEPGILDRPIRSGIGSGAILGAALGGSAESDTENGGRGVIPGMIAGMGLGALGGGMTGAMFHNFDSKAKVKV